MTSLADLKVKLLQNPEFRAAYEALEQTEPVSIRGGLSVHDEEGREHRFEWLPDNTVHQLNKPAGEEEKPD